MAWTDQCKIAFRTTAEDMIYKRGGKGVGKVLRHISRESGIPYKTLDCWYYPKKNNLKTQVGPKTESEEHPICPICNIRKRKRNKRNGEWYCYPYCKKCQSGEEEVTIICPHCDEPITIQRKEVL